MRPEEVLPLVPAELPPSPLRRSTRLPALGVTVLLLALSTAVYTLFGRMGRMQAVAPTGAIGYIAVAPQPTCQFYKGPQTFDPKDHKCCHSFESAALCPLHSTCCCHTAQETEGEDCLGGVRCCTSEECNRSPGKCPKHLLHNASDHAHARIDHHLCGHSPAHCNEDHPQTPSFFTTDCWQGGIGCNAHGKKCCRFCGYGDYTLVKCPRSTAPSTSTSTLRRSSVTPSLPASAVTTTMKPVGPIEGLLHPVSTEAPDPLLFQRHADHYLPHVHTEVAGAKSTNKFWTSWVVPGGSGVPIYAMPYALKWGHQAGGAPRLLVSHGKPHPQFSAEGKVKYYFTPFIAEFALGAMQSSSAEHGTHTVVYEDLFGIHVEVRGTGQKITFPIFSGMAYVSGLYSGGFTPQITSEAAITETKKVRDGIFSFRNNRGAEFRVYVLDNGGAFVEASYSFSPQGSLNKPLDGWVRLARVTQPSDRELLDAHAQAVVMGVEMDAHNNGRVQYRFKKAGASDIPMLHWAYAHHLKLMVPGASQRVHHAQVQAPTKGHMRAVIGDQWMLQVDLTEVERVDFLPTKEPRAGLSKALEQETQATLKFFDQNWQSVMLRHSYYFSGKGFQKVGMVCLLAEKFFGQADARTQSCATLLAQGFRCLTGHRAAGNCSGTPPRLYYDEQWGGVVTSAGYSDAGCTGGADFGNACYNDHHYHFGYFVVSAAILAKLSPAHCNDDAFISFVNMLIRDTTNPSKQDGLFPRFRSFDWFELHSWSRGLPPSADGKDQESTSEEVNLLWGLRLWGGQVGNRALRQLGTTMLALEAVTIREFFLMKSNNPHHHPDFASNHVTGIFFQNKVDYVTWFGAKKEFIHGIQMLPLSPALQLTRKTDFCRQEWEDVVSKLPLPSTDPWTSILLSGSLAMLEPERAYARLSAMQATHFDDGLSKAWALYWAAAQ